MSNNFTNFDPEYEEKQMIFDQMVRSTKKIERKDEDELLHGEDGGMVYKYDLPVVNLPILFNKSLIVLGEKDQKEVTTPVIKLFEILDCDKDTAYESFIIKFNQ